MKHTSESWKQGRLLPTLMTRRWSNAEFERTSRTERCRVYSGFSGADEGRSRILICTCEDEDTAKFIASTRKIHLENERLKTANKELLEALKEITNFCRDPLELSFGVAGIIKIAEAAIAKAKGEQTS